MTDQINTLYVDDEPDLLKLGKIFLERSGEFNVTTVIGAYEAIDLIKGQLFDVIVSDYQMPKMDGIAFLKYLKTEGNTTPFILFTGRGREEVIIEALNNGADFYLQKGGDPKAQFAELSNKIRYTVSLRRAEYEIRRKNEELQAAYEEISATEEELRANLDELIQQDSALRLSEERLLMAQEIGQTGCWEFNVGTNSIWGSAEGHRIFGFTPVAGDFSFDELEGCIPDHMRVRATIVNLIKDNHPYNIEYIINPADGSAPRIIHSVARLERDAENNPIRVLGVIQDVTELKRTESLLKETHEALLQAQSIAHVGSWVYNFKTGSIIWSDELHRVFGHEPRAINLDLDTMRRSIHPDDLQKYDKTFKNALDTQIYEPTKYRIVYPDGSVHCINTMGSVEVDENGVTMRMIGVCQKIF